MTGIDRSILVAEMASLEQQQVDASNRRRAAEDDLCRVEGASRMVRHLMGKLDAQEASGCSAAASGATNGPPVA